MYHFYPFAKDRREKINELQALVFDDQSASDAQKFLAPPKLVILEKNFWQKRENVKKCRKCSKKSENVRTLPNASERIRTCPNASGKVRTGPNTSPNLRKTPKTSENFRKFPKVSEIPEKVYMWPFKNLKQNINGHMRL